jgi:hypothetical protein
VTPLHIVVTGSRDWSNHATIANAINDAHVSSFGPVVRLAHGGASGADTIAAKAAWAAAESPEVVEYPYIRELGRAGGPARNRQMLAAEIRIAEEAGARLEVLAFHPYLPASRGTRDCFWVARFVHDLPVYLYELD